MLMARKKEPPMSNELPPLPIAAVDEHNLQGGRLLYSRAQMLAYGKACAEQERERCAEVCEEFGGSSYFAVWFKKCAAEIRKG